MKIQIYIKKLVKLNTQKQPTVALKIRKAQSSIMFLARQGFALREHIDSESNLLQLLMNEWITAGKYRSHVGLPDFHHDKPGQ